MFIRYPTRLHYVGLMVSSLDGFTDGIMIGVGSDRGSVILNANTRTPIMLRDIGSLDDMSWLPQLVIRDSEEACNSATAGDRMNSDVFNGVTKCGNHSLYSVQYDGYVYFKDAVADHEPIERKELTATGRSVYAGDSFYTGIPTISSWTGTTPTSATRLSARGALYDNSSASEKWARWIWPRWVGNSSGEFVPVDTVTSTKYVVGNPQWKNDSQTFTRVPNIVVKDDGTFDSDGYIVKCSDGRYTVTYDSRYGYLIGGYGSADGWWQCSSMTPKQNAVFQFMTPEEYSGEQKENIILEWNAYVMDVGGPAMNVYFGEIAMWR